MSLDPEEIKRQQAIADETRALQDAFAKFKQTGIVTTKSDAELLAHFREGRDIVVDNGVAYVTYDAEKLPLDVALTRYAFDLPAGEVDRRTLPRTGTTARPGITSKADLDTLEKKVAYVQEFGNDAFERLPLRHVQAGPLEYKSQWRKLSIEERVRRTHEDPHAFEKLKDDPPAQAAGIRYEKPGLAEEIRRKSPNLRLPGWSGTALRKKAG